MNRNPKLSLQIAAEPRKLHPTTNIICFLSMVSIILAASQTLDVYCRGYMAPEYIDRGIISKKADIFSLGVIIVEIITGHRDYPNIGERTETSLKHYTDEVRLFSIITYINFVPYANVFFEKLLMQMFRWLEVGRTDF